MEDEEFRVGRNVLADQPLLADEDVQTEDEDLPMNEGATVEGVADEVYPSGTSEPRYGQAEWRLAYRVALKILKAPDQAEDAAQETLLRAYRAHYSPIQGARFETWLHRIAYTTALGFLRMPHYRRYQSPSRCSTWDEELALMESPAESPEQEATAHQLATRLHGCLCTMQAGDRLAFTERFLLGTSERELGELLGVSTNAAKQRAFRARRVVRRYLEEIAAGDAS